MIILDVSRYLFILSIFTTAPFLNQLMMRSSRAVDISQEKIRVINEFYTFINDFYHAYCNPLLLSSSCPRQLYNEVNCMSSISFSVNLRMPGLEVSVHLALCPH